MTLPATTRLIPDVTREICLRAKSKAYISGTISSLGSEYVLGLKAVNCQNGSILAQGQVTAETKEKVLDQLGAAASRLRSELGESLASVQKFDVPLAEATTPSLEALKAYSTGWKTFSSSSEAAAIPFYKRAIEIDPQFAMAYAWLGDMYGQMGESDLSAENIRKAYQLQERASDEERFFITASYYIRVTGNLEKAEQTCLAWAQTYPREMPPHGLLSGVIYGGLGRYDEAVEQNKKAIALNPDAAVVYITLAGNYLYLDRLNTAENALQTGLEREPQFAASPVLLYDIAFLKGDQAGMERQVVRGQGKAEDVISYSEAFALAYSGHMRQARRMSQRASDLAQQSGRPEKSALFQTGAAVSEAFFGYAPVARQKALAALEVSKDREVEYGAAVALALSGDTSQARTSPTIWQGAFPKILRFDSITRRRFARSWHSTVANRQRPLRSYKSPFL